MITLAKGMNASSHFQASTVKLIADGWIGAEFRSLARIMRVLLTGIACMPNSGSEAGVTWNWAWHLSMRNQVCVITHGAFRRVIDDFLAQHPNDNLHFEWVDSLGWLSLKPPQDLRLHYVLWLRAALHRARRLLRERDFDIIHHVSFNTVSAPPPFWRLEKPFVWGPVGGGQTTPMPLLWCFRHMLVREEVRTLRILLLPFLPGLRKAVAHSRAIFAVNRETARVLSAAGAGSVPLMLDCAVPPELFTANPPQRKIEGPFTAIWAGRIEPRKGLDVCLAAARLLRSGEMKLLIAGDGPDSAKARRFAARLGIANRVNFLGRVAWSELQDLFRRSHVLLFTSVRDSSGWVCIEAMAQGCPVICLDHQGMGTHLPAEAAVKIPVGGPRAVAQAFAAAVERLASDRSRLRAMSEAARAFAQTQRWDSHVRAMEACYGRLVSAQRIQKEAAD
ncbi:MAG TPA: glycosyltransferase [Stellaceae bacterium]|nr:glycosyltransferase [Stellaceae bacterium]